MYSETYGEYCFRLQSDSDQAILKSWIYDSLESCEKDIHRLQELSQDLNNYEIENTENGKCIFFINDENKEALVISQEYVSKYECENAITSTVETALSSEIVECV
jgi:uncharacterized protein YegP (UPF0339 family)